MTQRVPKFPVIFILVILILYCLSQFYTVLLETTVVKSYLGLVHISTNVSISISKFHQLQSPGKEYKFSAFDSRLIRKYWELQAWLQQIHGNDTIWDMPDPPEFFQFPTGYNLWDPSGFIDSRSDEDRLIAQDVWRMQSLIKNYFNKTMLEVKTKKIYIGDLIYWDDWALDKSWRDSKHVTGCYEADQSKELSNLESICDLVVEEPEDWSSIDILVSFQKMPLYFTRNVPQANLTLLTFWKHHFSILTSLSVSTTGFQVTGESLVVRKYNKWIYYDPTVGSRQQSKNYTEGKSKMAAILVSNCKHVSNDRLGYVKKLQKYMDVDVFGKCGSLSCDNWSCFKLFQEQYRFYLSFENANCRDYITEKLYRNAFKNDLVPVVMGAHPDDYKSFAPQNSYIHIEDFESPQELAAYLTFLAENPSYYNKYFEWRGTGEFTDYAEPEFFCRLCSMLQYGEEVKPKLSQSNKFDWLPDASINLNGDKMCLEKGKWYWDRKSR